MISRLMLSALLALAIGSAFAQTADPVKALKEIQDFQKQQFSQANGKAIDFAAIDAQMKSKAQDAIKGLDPEKIADKDAFKWAELFSMAGEHKTVCALSQRFLKSNPTPEERFKAQMLMMQSCNELGEGAMIDSTLKKVTAPGMPQAQELMSYSVYEFADTIAKTQGPNEAYKTLRLVEAKMPNQDLSKVPAASQAAARAESNDIHLTFAQKEAELLIKANHKKEGIRLLDNVSNSFKAELPKLSAGEGGTTANPKKGSEVDSMNRLIKRVAIVKTQLTLPGTAAPAVNMERGYGDFKGLESLKGKVVILDFFAHWCGPCKASFPEMEKLYDELKDQGVQVVGITTYYGYFGKENRQKRDMTKDVEYGHMADFIKEYKLPWPVVYGDRANFDNFGVTGIPHVVLIDKTGKVNDIKIGYDEKSFPEFRAKVIALLKA